MEMEYRRLGDAGVKVSVLSFGSWVSFHNQLGDETALECMRTAYEGGMNFFDNAEVYAGGEAERLMGRAIRELGWPRHTYLISTKLYWGVDDGVNTTNTLNRKYLFHAIEASLERLDHDFVDLLFCHRADRETPIWETVHAMSEIVDRGWAHYWGTSEWSADEIRAAWDYATAHGLHRPVMEQPQYNLLHRRRVEREYRRLYTDIGLGTTIWSPLGSGLLTGKYLDGIPEGSRGALEGFDWLAERLTAEDANEKVRQLQPIAEELDCSLAQLAIAWCARNPDVSTVITGASRPEQVEENLGALRVLPQLTAEVMERIDQVVS
jgi:voltage-dependent potassium channel beta subunit